MRPAAFPRLALAAALVFAAVPGTAHAQSLRGTLVHADGATPASGAIVVLLHATRDSILARAVTGARGTYAVTLASPSTVRVEVRRVGQQPMSLGTLPLAAGETRVVDAVLVDAPIVLAGVDTRAAARCDVRPDSAGLVAQLYEEARKALIVSATQAAGTRNTAVYTLFTRVETLRGRPAGPVQRTRVSGPSSRPFASIGVDSLARVGYVVEERDGVVYRAPDAEVLLSDTFAATHCLHYVDGTGDRKTSMGIGFRPVASRRGYVDIRGTLWFDRATSELQLIEYTYEGIPREHQRGGVGGRVELARTADGGWLVSRWAIRMPRVTVRQQEGSVSRGGGVASGFTPLESVVDTIVVTGGEVLSVHVDGELQYASAATISADDGSGATPAPAPGAAPGTVASATPAGRVDTLRAESTCEGLRDPLYRGVVAGRVLDGDRAGRTGAPVTAEWKQDFRHLGGHEWVWEYRQLTTTSTANGQYVLCGAPIDRPVTVRVADSAASRARAGSPGRGVVVRVTPRDPRAVVDLTVGMPTAVASGRASLVRVVDAGGQPVAHALVRVSESLTRVADADGRVVVPVLTRDSVRLLVRRIGFTPFEGWVRRQADGEAVTVALTPVPDAGAQRLAAVTVRARGERSPLERSGFYDRVAQVQRGAMVGEFFTPEEIELRGAARLSQLLHGSRHARVVYIAEPGDRNAAKGVPVLTGRGGCAMTVVVDGQRVGGLTEGGRQQMPMDDVVSMMSVAAVEVYPTASGAPAEFIALTGTGASFCGIVAIWTGAHR